MMIYYLKTFIYSVLKRYANFYNIDMYDRPIRNTTLLKEVIESNRSYYNSIPKTSLSKAKKLKSLGVNSVENLTNAQINNLENKVRFGKRYIPQESLDNILEMESFYLYKLEEYDGIIPERVLDSIKKDLNGVFSVYERIDGKYVISDENINRTQIFIHNISGRNANSPDKYKFQRKDFILVKKEKVGFEDFKNNSDVNKCEQALYLTELFGGYRIIESW